MSVPALRNLQVTGADVAFDVELGYPGEKPGSRALRARLEAAARSVPGVAGRRVNLTTKVVAACRSAACKCCPA